MALSLEQLALTPARAGAARAGATRSGFCPNDIVLDGTDPLYAWKDVLDVTDGADWTEVS